MLKGVVNRCCIVSLPLLLPGFAVSLGLCFLQQLLQCQTHSLLDVILRDIVHFFADFSRNAVFYNLSHYFHMTVFMGGMKVPPLAVVEAFADGFYILTEPLKKGSYPIHFKSSLICPDPNCADPNFVQDITYNIIAE